MALRQKTFLFYLVDSTTGLAYYVDGNGNIQKAPIGIGFDISLQHAPDGWMTSELGFIRNARYYGINRSFTIPQKLIDDAAFIVRSLTNLGKGIEVPLSMLIFKYNDQPQAGEPQYQLYYKGQLDLPNHIDIANEGYQVNMMEGGVLQMLKNLENTVIEIPCDGSLNEAFPDGTFARNIKVNMDGMFFEDTLNYQIIPMTASLQGVSPLPCVFIDDDGDNAGVVHNNPTYDPLSNSPFASDYYQASPNYLLGTAAQVTLTIEGSITVASGNSDKPVRLNLFLATNQTVPISGTDTETRTLSLLPAGGSVGLGPDPTVSNQTTLPFSGTFTISANSIPENMFLMFDNAALNPAALVIIGGSFAVTYSSMYPATTPWCVTLYDLGRVLIKYACEISSKTGQPFNYQFASTLLQNNLNLVATSGDALRASGDPNYQKFYNALQNNPNFPNINLVYSFGPVIKTTIADFFDSVNAILNASLSTQTLAGQGETLFIERKGYVFDSTVVNLENGEVSDFKSSVALDLMFTLLKIGYAPQQYDQQAGKYAWNTTLELQAPIKSIPNKTLEIISKYLTEPYLMERLRANVDAISMTRNSSDSSVFVINTDPSKTIQDSYSAIFQSAVIYPIPGNPNAAGNTNNKMIVNQQLQSLPMSTVNGSYMAFSSDPTIFLFNQRALSGISMPLTLQIVGTFMGYAANVLSGLPADSTTINLVINGVVVQTWTYSATGALVGININYTLTRAWSFRDCIYLTCSTSANGTTTLNTVNLSVANVSGSGGTGAAYLTASGSAITVDTGVPQQLISLPVVGYAHDSHSLPVISYGFQYFVFNSVLLEPNFNALLTATALLQGGSGDIGGWDVFLNGQVEYSKTWPGAGSGTGAINAPPQDSYAFNRNFENGDILFLVGSATNLSVWFTEASLQLTSTQIQAVDLMRVQYDYISGLPVLCGYTANGVPVTTGPGAPYNIEVLTPGRMLRTWGNYLRSILFDQVPGELLFSTLSKNEYLATSYEGVSIIENANINISDLDPILFYPRYISYKTRVQETFATIMTGAANGHASNLFNSIPFYGFTMEMKQRPSLNEMQDWKLLASPRTDLTQLINLEFTGLNFLNMSPNSIFCSFLSPVQFVPSGQVLPSKYHTFSRNYFWFVEQVTRWINQNNYWQPWQNEDPCNLQFITRDLNQVTVNLYDCAGNLISATPLTQKSSNAIVAPYFLWEGTIDLSTLPASGYYMTAVAGSGAITATLISEGLNVQANWLDTLLFEYTHSSNNYCVIFDTGYSPAMRIRGMFDNQFKQKFKAAFYIDQMQDSQVLNAFPYETTPLWCGLDDGIPDYVHRKVTWALLCNGCMIEGEGFSIDDGAGWEETFIAGNPKKFQKIEIRPSQNIYGISATAAGADTDTSMLITLDAGAFSPNAGNVGGTDPDIIQVLINS
jgi:hypothetical protein